MIPSFAVRFEANPQLGTWVSNQRKAYKKKRLSKERVDRLNEIGFVWDAANLSALGQYLRAQMRKDETTVSSGSQPMALSSAPAGNDAQPTNSPPSQQQSWYAPPGYHYPPPGYAYSRPP